MEKPVLPNLTISCIISIQMIKLKGMVNSVKEYTLKKNAVQLNEEYDVIVCGGGPAGCAAAASAAREGAKTLLLESSGMLGGMATSGMVNAWTTGYDGFRRIYGGLFGKLVEEMYEHTPVEADLTSVWLPIDYEWLKLMLDEMVTGAGAQVLFHSQICGLEMKDDRNIDVVLVSNKSGITAYRAKVFIDCTGDADLYAWAGKPYAKGDEDGNLQATTMCYSVAGINDEAFAVMNDPWYTGEGHKNRALLYHIMQEGKYDIQNSHYVPRQLAPHVWTFNAGHVFGVDSTDPKSLSNGIIEGRKLARTFYEAFHEYAPEVYKDARLMQTASTLGVRESRIIEGDYQFTLHDFLARRSFPDEVFRGKYMIDVHESSKHSDLKTDETYERYGKGESYGVPYRCLCPRDLDNVLVAGRTISSDRLSNGSLRIISCCMCGGEAVGMAAKYAADMEEVNIHKVDTQILRRRLMEEGAYLPKQETDTF